MKFQTAFLLLASSLSQVHAFVAPSTSRRAVDLRKNDSSLSVSKDFYPSGFTPTRQADRVDTFPTNNNQINGVPGVNSPGHNGVPSIGHGASGNLNTEFQVNDLEQEMQTVSWNAAEAAEFVIFHANDPSETGRQLAPLIAGWGGNDVAEFLTRIYLAKPVAEYRLAINPQYVQNPRWRGLGKEGLDALRAMLLTALGPKALEPKEISRFAQSFLLRPHGWPNGDGVQKNQMSNFYQMGHAAALGSVYGSVRRHRIGSFSVRDVVDMLILPEQKDKAKGPMQVKQFFSELGIKLTSNEKVSVVQGLAMGGWSPAAIAQFMSIAEEIPSEPFPAMPVENQGSAVQFERFPREAQQQQVYEQRN